jgi:hypothetical protein
MFDKQIVKDAYDLFRSLEKAHENNYDPRFAKDVLVDALKLTSNAPPFSKVKQTARDFAEEIGNVIDIGEAKIKLWQDRLREAAGADGVPGFSPPSTTPTPNEPPPGSEWQPTIIVTDNGTTFSQGPDKAVSIGSKLPNDRPYYTGPDGSRIYPPPGGWANGIPATGTEAMGFNEATITQAQQLFYHIEFDLSPLILDLDGNGVSTRALADGAYFDHNGNGLAESTGWVGAGDALLVRDINGNGIIDNGAELFGNYTLLANGSWAANGFAALAALDMNADSQVNAQDADWSSLRLWKDGNANGITDAGELITLAAAGVQSLGTGYVNYGNNAPADAQGNWHRQAGEARERYVFNSCLRSNLLACKAKNHENDGLKCRSCSRRKFGNQRTVNRKHLPLRSLQNLKKMHG